MIPRIASKPFVTRGELSDALGLTYEIVLGNEHRLGLDVARREINKRLVLFDTAIAIQQLSLRGMLPSTLTHLQVHELPHGQVMEIPPS